MCTLNDSNSFLFFAHLSLNFEINAKRSGGQKHQRSNESSHSSDNNHKEIVQTIFVDWTASIERDKFYLPFKPSQCAIRSFKLNGEKEYKTVFSFCHLISTNRLSLSDVTLLHSCFTHLMLLNPTSIECSKSINELSIELLNKFATCTK